MKIFVQGRKRGYSVLYPFPTPDEFYNFAMDIQSINAQNQSYYYGKALYSIAFSRGGRIFTKYVLGYDVQRSNLGNISFSVYIPDNKILPGADIRELLDELSSYYFKTYAPNFFIGDTPENWGELAAIANKFDAKLISVDQLDIEHIDGGNQDAAFIYYSSLEQLIGYLDDPYQKIYTPYSQVFLVDASLKDRPENPLNALKHSSSMELSGQIDLENKKYRLIVSSASFAKVKRLLSDGRKAPMYSNDRFFKKDVLCIEWAKQYHQTVEKQGAIDTLKEYLDINELNRTVTILPVKLQILSKDIQPQFILRDSAIEVDSFRCTNAQGEDSPLKEGKLHFEGAQLTQTWTIVASKGASISIKGSFVPESSSIVLPLRASEKKEVSFVFTDKETGEPIHSVEISFVDSRGNRRREYGSIVFSNEDLDKKFLLDFSARGYHPLGPVSITPRTVDKDIPISLVPRPKPKQEDLQWLEQPQNPDRVEPKGPKKSWFKRNFVSLILAFLLVISMLLNAIQYLYIYRQRAGEVVKSAKEYVGGTELIAGKLRDYSKKKAVKSDWNLDKSISSALRYRGFVDMPLFQIDNWEDNYSLNQSPELSRFYKLCTENKPLIKKMENRLKELWGQDIKSHPLCEITDSLTCFMEREKLQSVVNEPAVSEIIQDQPINAQPTAEPDSPANNESSTIVDIPAEEKPGLFKRLFGKRKK